MKSNAPLQPVLEPTTKPVVEPSIPQPTSDPLHDVRDVVEALRRESAQAPREYLDEIRIVLGAE